MSSVAESWRALEGAGIQVIYRTVTTAEVGQAEATLGCALPMLVTSVGAAPTRDGLVWDSFAALSEHLVVLITELAAGEYRSFRLVGGE